MEQIPKFGLGGQLPGATMLVEAPKSRISKLSDSDKPLLSLGRSRISMFSDSEKSRISPECSLTSVLAETDSFVNDPTLPDLWSEDDALTLSDSVYRTESSIQTLKSSLFTNLEKVSLSKQVEKSVIKPKDVPSQVLTSPKVYKLPDVSLTLHEKRIANQRCYNELGVFRNNTYKVGWGKGLTFFNFELMADKEFVYALNECKMQINTRDSYNNMMPNLTDLLNITLEESWFKFDQNKVPTLTIKRGLRYLKRQTEIFNDHVHSQVLSGKEKYLCSVWNLCTALWGEGDNTPCARKQYLSDWLTRFAHDLYEDWSLSEPREMSESEAYKTVFKLLSFHKIKQAYEFAVKKNLTHLSMMISQLNANERFKYWMRRFIETFAWKEKNIIPDDFKKLYLLLSGVPQDGSIIIVENLDWMRCFGVFLWYLCPAGAPIDVSLRVYKKAFEESQHVTNPIPPYCEREEETTDYDILYHILSAYANSTYQLSRLLHPETHTDNTMDYRLSWFMLHLFLSLKVGLIRESEKEHLHTTFSSQLENMGLWKWAIFALLYLDNNALKKTLIMRILDRNLATFTETARVEEELVNTFRIPPSWIHEVKATKAKAAGYYYEYFQHYVYKEEWQQANNALVEYIIPELFIGEQYNCLLSLLSKLAPVSKSLANWNTQGGLFKDFIELRDLLHSSHEEDVKSIAGKLSSLFRRISCFPAKNDKQRLCAAELSRQCALLSKLIQKTLDSHTFQTKFVDLLQNLVMPPDIQYYELEHIMSKNQQTTQLG